MASIQYTTYRTSGATSSGRGRTESPAPIRTRYSSSNLINNTGNINNNNMTTTTQNIALKNNQTSTSVCKKQLIDSKISTAYNQTNNQQPKLMTNYDMYSYNSLMNNNSDFTNTNTIRRSSIKSNGLTTALLPNNQSSSIGQSSLLSSNKLNQQNSNKIREILGTTASTNLNPSSSNLSNKSNKYKSTLSRLNGDYPTNSIENNFNGLNINDDLIETNSNSNNNKSGYNFYHQSSSSSDLNGPTQFFPSSNNQHVTSAYITTKSSNLLPSPSSTSSSSSSSSPPLQPSQYYQQKSSFQYDVLDDLENKGIVGLKNLGNTCFMNSILQCLSNTKCLLEYCLRGTYVNDLNTNMSVMKGSLFRSYADLIKKMWKSDDLVSPSDFKSQIARFAPRFVGYAQQDAEEFLYYLLKGLHEDVNLIKKKPTPIKFDEKAWDKMNDIEKSREHWEMNLRFDNSRINDMFVGQLKSTLQCTKCNYRSPTFELFWHLALPIPNKSTSIKLDDCLRLFMSEEVLDGDNKPVCSTCKEKRRCTKRYTIEKLPKILVLHLKRFSKTRFNSKINVNIDYPIDGLDMSKYLSCFVDGSSSSYTSRPPSSSYMYDLYGISLHSGTESSGHYVAYAKHPYNKQWNCFNDSMVRSISHNSLQDSNAYILFYQLRGS